MAAQVLADLEVSVAAARGAMVSATTLINGIAAKVQAAVEAAVANGATEAELAPVQTVVDGLNTDSAELARAVAANP